MAFSRFAPLLLAAFACGCASNTPEPDAPAPTPVIELDEPVEEPVAKKPKKADKTESKDTVKRAAAKKRVLDRKIAENAGVLAALRDAGELDAGFGSSAMLTADEPVGGLVGTGSSLAGSGMGGLGLSGGLSGTGRGGGGTGQGTIGLGKVGNIGGYGSGSGSGYGRGTGRVGRTVTTGTPQIVGKLDKNIIRRVMRRHVNQVRYCYERELRKNPKLEGKVVTKFVIGASGKVASVVIKSGMDPKVDSCVMNVMKRMRFPKPEGGGIVMVTYPYVFKTASPKKATPKKAAPKPSP